MIFMSDVKKKRGRPREKGARRKRVYMYLSDLEYDMLKDASESSGKSVSELARIGAMRSSSEVLSSSKGEEKEAEFVDESVGYYADDDFYDPEIDDSDEL